MRGKRLISRRTTIYQKVMIPEGHVKCPDCKGSGFRRWRWGGPGSNDYKTCFECRGLGYISDEQMGFNQRLKLDMALYQMNWDWFYNVLKDGGS